MPEYQITDNGPVRSSDGLAVKDDPDAYAGYLDWLAAGGEPVPLPASPISQILALEASITPRMVQEAAIGSTLTGLGEDRSLTSAQFIEQVRTQISTLRHQLAG